MLTVTQRGERRKAIAFLRNREPAAIAMEQGFTLSGWRVATRMALVCIQNPGHAENAITRRS